ncbi:hypothetical protein K505DRAFT_263537 [Melanomma pulvis-pyrius CBS 109.77]|uniref:Uncharacterized protein n=1 Tax=Melanomma pulvis-pyrius CBS 109.77 TaxID=1314802 RepID=A0A6A6XY95_9PLEO|nr:hypothetical protein K505DRAFT_263537 [Melanomma pulvis-pyrius CBS 109.77]
MCRKASCGNCHKTTWWGCGQHIPGVMSNVPSSEWCVCSPKVEREGTQYPPMGTTSS